MVVFFARGALGDFWAWTVIYNATVAGPGEIRPPERAFLQLNTVARRVFDRDSWLVLLAVIGGFTFGASQVGAIIARGSSLPELWRHALVLPPFVYFLFSLINFQAGPDLIPFVPFIGLFVGWFVVAAGRRLARVRRQIGPFRLDSALPGAFAAALLALLFVRNWAVPVQRSLANQAALAQRVAQLLSPGDQIYVHGDPTPLVLLNRSNLNPYVLLNTDIELFEAIRRNAPFMIVAEIAARPPKVLWLTRINGLHERDFLDRWVADHYDAVPGTGGLYTLRSVPR